MRRVEDGLSSLERLLAAGAGHSLQVRRTGITQLKFFREVRATLPSRCTVIFY